jgi:hypothetical protein
LEYLARQQADDGSIADDPARTPSTSTAPATTTATVSATTTTAAATAPSTAPATTTAPATAPSVAPEQPSRVTTTSRALLAFLAAGNAPDVGRYGLVVRGEIDFLLDRLSKGDPARDGGPFAHAVTALALAEAYGFEQRTDSRARIRHTLTKMLPVILSARSAGQETDPRLIGWISLARSACRDIGFEVPDDATRAAAPAEEVFRPPGPPVTLDALVKNQSPDGSWPPVVSPPTAEAPGRVHTTAMSVLTLTAPYKLLPLYAR